MLIKIKNLKLRTTVGVYDWEQKFEREIIVNAEIETDLQRSLASDDLTDTINYEILTDKIKNTITKNHFKLIEKMAQEVMNQILQDQRIRRCKIEIDKVGVFDFVESFSVTIEQNNNHGS